MHANFDGDGGGGCSLLIVNDYLLLILISMLSTARALRSSSTKSLRLEIALSVQGS